jgi:16S rRNA (cytidine1402-2'-O)-methyltransferase
MQGKLYLVSIPIGNYDDLSFRAVKILESVDFIICEEFKEAVRFLNNFKIKKELFELNEHNENEASEELFKKISDGKSAALISDCGTPVFSDPGLSLVQKCINENVPVIPVPGANSILPALISSGLNIDKFYYFGWLSPKKEIRRKQLFDLKKIKEVIVILDTPYRIKALLKDISMIFGKSIKVALAYQLTMKDEEFFRGTIESVRQIAEKKNLKGEFVLIINNRS